LNEEEALHRGIELCEANGVNTAIQREKQ